METDAKPPLYAQRAPYLVNRVKAVWNRNRVVSKLASQLLPRFDRVNDKIIFMCSYGYSSRTSNVSYIMALIEEALTLDLQQGERRVSCLHMPHAGSAYSGT